MFDVGFWELVMVGVVALLVVGPERLPKLAYELGLWIGRLQRYVRNARFQIENEIHNYEIKNSLQQSTRMLEDIKSELNETARDPWLSPAYVKDQLPTNLANADNAQGQDNAAGKAEPSSSNGQPEPKAGDEQSKSRT
jgi:sec-independent protein translocase protein TatB